MIGDRKKGGLGMPDFEVINNASKAVWVKLPSVLHGNCYHSIT